MEEEYIRVSGKTVEDALIEASIELGTSSDNIDYRVVERETKGFLGLGAKKAVIEARKKKSDEDIVEEVFHEKKESQEKPVKKEKQKIQNKRPEGQSGKTASSSAPVKKQDPAAAAAPKKEENTEQKKPVSEKKPQTQKTAAGSDSSALQQPASALKEKPARVPADPETAMKRAEDFLSGMFQAMGMEVKLDMSFENGTLSIELSGDDMGTLIGKRGQTLDSIQYLTSLVVNKGKASYVKVKIDTENYRERRAATLENLARNIAFKVKKTRRPVYLEPMNPYERRIIHSALQNDPYVTTHSEGEEPNRKVVVTLKKREHTQEDEEES